MKESNKILLESWIKLFREIQQKFNTIEQEMHLANYPISQNTEDLRHITTFSLNALCNSLEEDLNERSS